VQKAAVVGSSDRIRGTTLKAFVVPDNGYEPSESVIRDIKNYVKRTTAPYKYPREIKFIAELPKTIFGKNKTQ
jgi:acetyl-CoA synthetase